MTSLARIVDGLMLAFGIVLVLCATAKPAFAYVDPGSGLFLLQIIGTTLAGFTFMVRKRIRQMLSMFGTKAKKLD